MKLVILFTVVLASIHVNAQFGLLGREGSCPYNPQQSPMPAADYQYALRQQTNEYGQRVSQLQAQLNPLNQELLRMQGNIRYYFKSPVSEAMIAHMDNGFDCCSAQRQVSSNSADYSRMPAGNDMDVPHETTATPVAPYEPPVVTPRPVVRPAPQPVAPVQQNSCYGGPAQYCDNSWGPAYQHPQSSSQQCLTTGFAVQPMWLNLACRAGGQIDPHICANPRVSNYPQDAQRCAQTIQAYYQTAARKRQITTQIEQLNAQIQYTARPTQPTSYGPTQSVGGGYSSETTSGVGTFLSGLGNFAGGFLSGFLSRPSRPTYYPGSYMASRPLPPMFVRPGGPVAARPMPVAPVPYYGSSYGYPFANGGSYGQVVPGYTTGSIGCSAGAGSGLSLIGNLLGGLLANRNNRGPFSGYPNYAAFNQLYGNRVPGQPIQMFNGVQPLYRPGGIYGTTPISLVNNNNRYQLVQQQPVMFQPGYNGVNNGLSNLLNNNNRYQLVQTPNLLGNNSILAPQYQNPISYRPPVPVTSPFGGQPYGGSPCGLPYYNGSSSCGPTYNGLTPPLLYRPAGYSNGNGLSGFLSNILGNNSNLWFNFSM